MVPVGGCSLVDVPVAVPVVWPVFPGVGPEPASCALAAFPVISHGPAWAVPTLRAITAQPARMRCFAFICHSLFPVFGWAFGAPRLMTNQHMNRGFRIRETSGDIMWAADDLALHHRSS